MDPLKKKYVLDLSEEEKERSEGLSSTRAEARLARSGERTPSSARRRRAEGQPEIAEALNAALSTVERVRKRFVEEGLEASLSERPRIGGASCGGASWTVRGEAYPAALACSEPPEGRERWTMRLSADRLVEVGLAADEHCPKAEKEDPRGCDVRPRHAQGGSLSTTRRSGRRRPGASLLRRLESHHVPEQACWLKQVEIWSYGGALGPVPFFGPAHPGRGDARAGSGRLGAQREGSDGLAWRFRAADAREKLTGLHPAQS